MRSLPWPRLRWTWTKPMFELQGIDHVALAVRDVERAYEEMWTLYQRGLPPADIMLA